MLEKMRSKHSRRGIYIILFLVILVQSCFIVYQIAQKNGYFIDEIYSYGLSNSYRQAFLNANNEAQNHWIYPEYFDDYLSVQSDEEFSYDSVYNNQVQDVHPPLFYMALHTISSFFPNQFSKWPAEILNVVYFIIAQIFLFMLSMKVFRKDTTLSISVIILYGCTMMAIDTIVLIRMYAMLTMWAVIDFYLHIRLLEDKPTFRKMLPIFVITYFGCLTHYYFLVLSFFLALMSCAYLIFRKQLRSLFIYGAGMCISVGAMIGTFPAIFEHLFGGRRVGNQTLANAQDIIGGIRRFISYLVQTTYGFLGTKYLVVAVILLFVFLLCAAIFKIVKNEKADRSITTVKNCGLFIYIAACILLILLVISIIVFDANSRYIYYLMPFVALCVVAAAYLLASAAWNNIRRFNAIALFVVICIGLYTYTFRNTTYLYNEAYANAQIVSRYEDCYGVLFCENYSNPAITQECMSLKEIKGVYCTDDRNVENFESIISGKNTDSGMIIWIDVDTYWSSGYNAEHIINTILNISKFTNSKMLYKYGLVEAYYIN